VGGSRSIVEVVEDEGFLEADVMSPSGGISVVSEAGVERDIVRIEKELAIKEK